MNTFQISTSSAKTEQPYKLLQQLRNPLELGGYLCLSDISIHYNWKNITRNYGNNELTYARGETRRVVTFPDGSYAVSDINNFLHNIMEINRDVDTSKAPKSRERYGINLYANETYNRVSLEVKAGYSITFPKGMAKVLGAAVDNSYGTATINLPNVPQLENVRSVQVHCNLVYNKYQSDSSLLFTFTPNGRFGSLLSPPIRFPIWVNTRQSATEDKIEVWLTNQDGEPIGVEDEWGVILQLADSSLVKL